MGNSKQERMEDISIAYVSAITAQNGYSFEIVRRDNDGVDARITCKGKPTENAIFESPQLEIQLKSSFSRQNIRVDEEGNLQYNLEVKNYNKLISTKRYIPLILVVLHMPENEDLWVVHTNEYLQLQKCAYWICLRGAEETTNKERINICIPKTNTFSPQALKDIIQQIGEGKEDRI